MKNLERAFQLLGIPPSSDAVLVRKAWRALVRSYHPDMAKEDPEAANRRLAEINAAFDAVCSCSDEDVAALRADLADRAKRAAETWKKEAYRHKAAAAARNAPQRDMAQPTEAQTGPNNLNNVPAAWPKEKPKKRVIKRDFARRIRHDRVSERAEACFSEAKAIMSKGARAPQRSVYM